MDPKHQIVLWTRTCSIALYKVHLGQPVLEGLFYSEATPTSFCPNSVLDPSDDGVPAEKQNPSVQVECCVKELPLLC